MYRKGEKEESYLIMEERNLHLLQYVFYWISLSPTPFYPGKESREEVTVLHSEVSWVSSLGLIGTYLQVRMYRTAALVS